MNILLNFRKLKKFYKVNFRANVIIFILNDLELNNILDLIIKALDFNPNNR